MPVDRLGPGGADDATSRRWLASLEKKAAKARASAAKKAATTKSARARRAPGSSKAKAAKAPNASAPKRPVQEMAGVGEAVGVARGGPRGVPSAAHAAGSGLGMLEMSGAEGLSDVLLDLVGEGHISIGHALVAWQREQDRVANRAWRRPGGLARMGGL